ncbi:MAG: TonB-dependent receptor [Melioribacteraceae bacterium]|nr:TonB-dependent receptor [Melioribacteraceae bacterium]MCF8430809.1 TonB-dependent receptor [Melioribacteraceae bacterium]
MLKYFVISFLTISTSLFSSSPGNVFHFEGTIRGIVIDAESNLPVESAVVKILETPYYEVTSNSGEFVFGKISGGSYQIEVTHISYKVRTIDYNFNTQESGELIIYLEPNSIEIAPVIVSGIHTESKFDELQEAAGVLKGRELDKNLGNTLASTLKNEAGLAIRSMGPAPARPVIRGLGGDRVLISEDGEKTIDLSGTSPDHAVTVEPFSIDRIEVLRGPKILLQTPTTIGGIVNIVRNEIPDEIPSGIVGSIGGYGESANSGYLGAANIKIPIGNFVTRAEISRRITNDLTTPTGKLKNSDSENFNTSLGTSWINKWGVIGGSFREFDLNYGVPGGFVGAHPNGVNIEMVKRRFNLKFDYKFSSRFYEKLSVDLSRNYYRHKEFESSGALGSEFRIITYLGRIEIHHKDFFQFHNGIYGVSFEQREFEIGGFVFTPPTNSLNISVYWFEHFEYNDFHFEASARYNFDIITPDYEKPNSNIGYIREKSFNTFSLSGSLLYDISDIVHIGANISKSSRVPTIEELFSEGPHLAAYSFEIGNPELESESGIGTELFIYHDFENLFFNLNIFRNDLSSYIIARNSGELNYSTFLPVYKTEGINAVIQGVEFQFDWKPSGNFSFYGGGSYTYGENSDVKKPLPQIPPFKVNLGTRFNIGDFNLSLSAEGASAQKRVDDFEKPTVGYLILNQSTQYSFTNSNMIHSFSLGIDNIFNKEYRNHLSRVKSIIPEAGRNIRLTYKMLFNY